MKPSVSIVIPCYNQAQYLDELLASLQFNDRSYFEVIIVDDGSDDELSRNWFENAPEGNWTIIRQENQGLAAARNAGIAAGNADYVLPLDADNLITEDYLKEGIAILDEQQDVGVVYSDPLLFGKENGHRELPDFDVTRFLAVNYIDACAIFRKEIWQQAGGYDGQMPFNGYEDWDLWISAYGQGRLFHHIPKPLFKYRVSEDSMITKANLPENRSRLYKYLINKHSSIYLRHFEEVGAYLVNNLAELEEEIGKISPSRLQEVLDSERQVLMDTRDALEQLNLRYGQVNQQLEKSISSGLLLEKRIEEIENSKLWKLKTRIQLLRSRLKSNSDQKKGLLSRIFVILGRKGSSAIRKLLAIIFKHLYLWFEETKVIILESGNSLIDYNTDPYTRWLNRNLPRETDIIAQKKIIDGFKEQPLFSIIIPVYNPPIEYFKAAIDSVLHQSYENWEICICDDASTDSSVKKVIQSYMKRDPRIRAVFRKQNGHISKASNDALELARGEYAVLMDQDDLLSADALFHNAQLIDEHPKADLIYSDEDKINEQGIHSEPHFKPDWSPDNLLSRNYLGHLTVFNMEILRSIGGWREGFEGSQDYDLVLRFVEKTNEIYHIPKVLYHWRIHSASAAGGEEAKPYAYTAAQKSLTEALERRGEEAEVDFLDGFRGYGIRLKIKVPDQLVSIIIPSKNQATILETCLSSIYEKSTYQHYEVILIDNNSDEASFFKLVEKWKGIWGERFQCIRTEAPFNFSSLMNLGHEKSKGDYLVLLNNDTEIISR